MSKQVDLAPMAYGIPARLASIAAQVYRAATAKKAASELALHKATNENLLLLL